MTKGPANSMDPTANIAFFEQLGFSKDEMVALMGAHSLGGVNPCTGSGAFDKKPYCNAKPEEKDRGAFFDTTPNNLDTDYFEQLKRLPADILLRKSTAKCFWPNHKKKGNWECTNPENFCGKDKCEFCNKEKKNQPSNGKNHVKNLHEWASFKEENRRLALL